MLLPQFPAPRALAAFTLFVLQEPVDSLLRYAQLGRNPRRTATELHQALRRLPATLPRISGFLGEADQIGMRTHQLNQRLVFVHTGHSTTSVKPVLTFNPGRI